MSDLRPIALFCLRRVFAHVLMYKRTKHSLARSREEKIKPARYENTTCTRTAVGVGALKAAPVTGADRRRSAPRFTGSAPV